MLRIGGLSVSWWLLIIPATLIALLILVFLFFLAQKAYWDWKLSGMCSADGGVTVYERVPISAAQREKLPTFGGAIVVPPEQLAKPDDPAFLVITEQVIKEWNPRVIRLEKLVKRRSDGRVVGKIVSYVRIGGDFPIGVAESTHFICPDEKALFARQAEFFMVQRRASSP